MKKGINAWSVYKYTTFEEMFKQLKAAGFDGVELNIDKDSDSQCAIFMGTTKDELLRIRELSEKYELPITSISTQNPLGGVSSVPELWDAQKQVIMKQIEAAQILGAKGILTVPGIPGAYADTVSLKKGHEVSIEFYKSIKAEVEDSRITVGLENVWNGFFLSPFDAARMIDEIGSDSIGMYFDVGNVVAFSNPEDWIEILGKRIKFVHVKDYLRNIRTLKGGQFVGVNNGSANWEKVVAGLQNIGYDGYLTAEVARSNPEMEYTDFYKLTADQIGEIIALEK